MDHTADTAIRMFLEHGPMGVLAMGFVVLLILFVRSDRRASRYYKGFVEASFDRSQLIQVVSRNSEASATLAAELGRMSDQQKASTAVIERMLLRMEDGRCPVTNRKAT